MEPGQHCPRPLADHPSLFDLSGARLGMGGRTSAAATETAISDARSRAQAPYDAARGELAGHCRRRVPPPRWRRSWPAAAQPTGVYLPAARGPVAELGCAECWPKPKIERGRRGAVEARAGQGGNQRRVDVGELFGGARHRPRSRYRKGC
jgi:hypothetical protein